MVNFTMDQVRALMGRRTHIRNLSVIAHVDHGKSTLCDSLIAGSGLLSMEKAGCRLLDTREDEQERTITIKSTGISLYYKIPEEWEFKQDGCDEYLYNLIDSPGHVDFSSEVTAALRISDGALVVVDCVEGLCVQTETVLRQALIERVKPVLAINKLDRAILELQLEPEQIYQNLVKMIEATNLLISTYSEQGVMGDLELNPEKGNVVFCSGIHGWSFNLQHFARVYAKKFKGVDSHKLVQKLWGEHYFDPETHKWLTSNTSASGKKLPRAFCKFILEPIIKLYQTCCVERDKEELSKLMHSLEIQLPASELQNQDAKKLIKIVMQKWLPAHESLFEVVTAHLPSPVVAQKYRVEVLYTGPMNDETAKAIRQCDPNGPLTVFISKMVPVSDQIGSSSGVGSGGSGGRFYAFGRVFSGTVKTGMKVRILSSEYQHEHSYDRFEAHEHHHEHESEEKKEHHQKHMEKSVQRTLVMMGKKKEPVDDVPCGNTVALLGIDQYLHKSGTVVNHDSSFPIVNMKYSVSPVLQVAVSPKIPSELPKLLEGMKFLSQSDPLVVCTTSSSTGQYIIAGVGELHLEICLKDLLDFMKGTVEVVVSQPIVNFCETVLDTSERVCLAKSPNKLNRLFVSAEPLGEKLTKAIDIGKISADMDVKLRTTLLNEEFGWKNDDAKHIWCFGPERTQLGTNILVDTSKSVQYLNEIKDSVITGFQWTTLEGVLCEESLRGVRFNVVDAMIHSVNSHRSGAQIIPTARRAFYCSQLCAKPTLLEPVYLIEIQTPQQALSHVYNLLNKKRGVEIISETQTLFGSSIFNVQAYLPVLEAFHFSSELRLATSGRAFYQCLFDHWSPVQGSPWEQGSKAAELVQLVRTRKGLAHDLPSLEKLLDKL